MKWPSYIYTSIPSPLALPPIPPLWVITEHWADLLVLFIASSPYILNLLFLIASMCTLEHILEHTVPTLNLVFSKFLSWFDFYPGKLYSLKFHSSFSSPLFNPDSSSQIPSYCKAPFHLSQQLWLLPAGNILKYNLDPLCSRSCNESNTQLNKNSCSQ